MNIIQEIDDKIYQAKKKNIDIDTDIKNGIKYNLHIPYNRFDSFMLLLNNDINCRMFSHQILNEQYIDNKILFYKGMKVFVTFKKSVFIEEDDE